MKELPKHKKLILFDGVCNLCNTTVQYVIKRDNQDVFRFAALQSDIGQEIIEEFKIDTQKTDSIILYSKKDGLTFKSEAALKIAQGLGFPYNMTGVFFIVPAAIRDWVYDIIAGNRYKWYGRRDQCMIPTEELNGKFLN